MNKIIQSKIFSKEKDVIICFIFLLIIGTLLVNRAAASVTPLSKASIEMMIQQNRVTLKISNKPIQTILSEIYKQTKINFIFKNETEKSSLSNMSITVSNVTVKEALDKLFTNTDFTYKIEDNVVTIVKKPSVKPNTTEQGNERVLIMGKVIEKTTKKPIVGATVVVVGKPSGAISDNKGAFNFLANTNDVLEVSYIGKKTILYSKKLVSSFSLIFEMEDDAIGIEDVVVTGYGNVSRADMVGDVTTLKADDIKITGKTNIAEMLQGQVAGMIVTNTSSRAGATPTIQIRGQSTLASDLGNQNPIWVVDGVIQDEPIEMNSKMGLIDDMKTLLGNQVSWLSPNDIETITILKDASATAIYGSRASNGVIVVTTKKPKTDKISISYSGSATVNTKPKNSDFNYMNSQERILFTEELFNSGISFQNTPIKQMNTFDGVLRLYMERDITSEQYLKRRAELETMNTDWFDIMTRTQISHSHNVSISGRVSNKLSVIGSLNYSKNNGQEIKNSMDNLSARMSLNAEVNKRLRINFSLNAAKSKNEATATGIASAGGGSTPLEYAKKMSRSIPAYDSDGSPVYYKVKPDYKYNNTGELSYNFINELNETYATNVAGRISMALQATFKLTEWLNYEFLANYTYSESARESFRSERSFSVANQFRGYDFNSVLVTSPEYKAATMPHGGTIDQEKATGNSYNIQNKLVFSKSLGNHRFNAMVANEVRSSNNKSGSNAMWGYLPDRGNKFAMPPKTFIPITGNSHEGDYGIITDLFNGSYRIYEKEDNFVSLFATFAYSYDNRYVLNANVRNDMSNRFGQDINSRFDPTYSFGLKWNITNEPYLKDKMIWLTNLNLSATYGIQGNALLSKSSELILSKKGISPHYNEFYSSISSIPNPYLTWERTSNWNFSVSGTLLKAINLNVSYYTRESNASTTQEIGFENGMSTINMNGGIIYNKGFEATVSFSPVATENFGINISVNSSKNWNKGGKSTLTESEQKAISSYLNSRNDMIVKEGYPLGAIWSYEFSHLDDEDGAARFKRMDSDPVLARNIPTSILVYSGQSQPYFTGGLNFSVRYKKLSLSSSFAAVLGGKKRLPNPYEPIYNSSIPDATKNLSKDLNKRWKKSGDELTTFYPGFSTSNLLLQVPGHGTVSNRDMWSLSDVMLVNSGFLRCTNLSMSYNFSSQLLDKIKLSNLSFNCSVSNLFVIGSKRYNGFDPELGDSVMPRTFSFSLNIGF